DKVVAEHPGWGGAAIDEHITQVGGALILGYRYQVRILRIDISGAGVGMSHDVAGFHRGQAVVERDRDRPEFPGRVDDRHDLWGVGPAPVYFVPRPQAPGREQEARPA